MKTPEELADEWHSSWKNVKNKQDWLNQAIEKIRQRDAEWEKNTKWNLSVKEESAIAKELVDEALASRNAEVLKVIGYIQSKFNMQTETVILTLKEFEELKQKLGLEK